jgi:hypothetical protein
VQQNCVDVGRQMSLGTCLELRLKGLKMLFNTQKVRLKQKKKKKTHLVKKLRAFLRVQKT